MKLSRIAEQRIRAAEARGELSRLKGAGKPLPESAGNVADEAGFRIMHEAGAVPREITLRKAVEAQRAVLAQTSDPDARKAEMGKLAALMQALEIEVEARRKFLGTR